MSKYEYLAFPIAGIILIVVMMIATEMYRSEVIKDYDLGVKNYLKCSKKNYSIKKKREDIVFFGMFNIEFRGGLTVRVLDCYWLDHHTDDYSKLKGKN